MGHKQYILALDQGTSSSRSILFDDDFQIIASHQIETRQFFPDDGWVEQDAEEIFTRQVETAEIALQKAGIGFDEIAGIGITNQRESFVVWDKASGKPVYHAIIWQDKRTADVCERMQQQEISRIIRRKTGLVSDPYFSATKLRWLFENQPELLVRAQNGELLFGTIDTWLIWKISGGAYHVTDVSNASRTMLFNIQNLQWDTELLDYFNIPKLILPEIVDSAGALAFTDSSLFFGKKIPISGIAGDQQAALFGQACYQTGMVKNTYGTGCFMLMNVGNTCPLIREDGLLRTLAWRIGNDLTYALEGSVFFAGATIQWMRDQLKLINSAEESEALAKSVKDTSGVYFVPAFAGLGTPYWDADARALIVGMTQATNSAHIVRAGLESLAYQTRDVLDLMQTSVGIALDTLRVDGGASANNFLMQFQADILGKSVSRPELVETTALGAAFLAGIGVGITDMDRIKQLWAEGQCFKPQMSESERQKKYEGWKRAVERSRGWYEG
ncbi:MAG: glycerol kinase GlpK [Bacteroidales bacterium]|jgi:glycerol kinase|nr:glycerol kinase GlpK [Bacteroidales bacterium]